MNLKRLGLPIFAVLSAMAFASSASATTLEVGGVTQTGAITIKGSLKSGTSALLSDTSGFFANTCTVSTIEGSDSTKQTGTAVEGPISTLSWGTVATPCKEGNPTIDAKGSLSGEWISGTTNATIKWKNAKVTVPSALGTLTCTTPEAGTDVGIGTGVASGTGTTDVNAVLSCGVDMKVTATYVGTGSGGLGATS